MTPEEVTVECGLPPVPPLLNSGCRDFVTSCKGHRSDFVEELRGRRTGPTDYGSQVSGRGTKHEGIVVDLSTSRQHLRAVVGRTAGPLSHPPTSHVGTLLFSLPPTTFPTSDVQGSGKFSCVRKTCSGRQVYCALHTTPLTSNSLRRPSSVSTLMTQFLYGVGLVKKLTGWVGTGSGVEDGVVRTLWVCTDPAKDGRPQEVRC